MILVGVFAYQLGGRALWLVPLTFVSVMALGGFLGVAGITVPFVETGIALSVIVLGAVVAFGVKAPLAAAEHRARSVSSPSSTGTPTARRCRWMPRASSTELALCSPLQCCMRQASSSAC